MFDFFTILAQHGIEVKQNYASEDEYKINCLFCTDMGVEPDYKYRLGFNISSGLGHCYHCGWSSRKAVIAILRQLGERSDEVRFEDFTRQTRERDKPQELPEGFVPLEDTSIRDPMLGTARKYLKDRGITEEQIRRHGIGATVLDYQYKNSIVFPVLLEDGGLAGFVSRDYTGQRTNKYLNSKGTKVLYNVFGDYPDRAVILSEGIIKALAIERAIGNRLCSAATLGNQITDVQIEGLRKFKEVVIFSDPDRAGLNGFLGVAANLRPVMKKVSFAWPLPLKQADEMEPKDIVAALKGRREFTVVLQLRIKMEARNRA